MPNYRSPNISDSSIHAWFAFLQCFVYKLNSWRQTYLYASSQMWVAPSPWWITNRQISPPCVWNYYSFYTSSQSLNREEAARRKYFLLDPKYERECFSLPKIDLGCWNFPKGLEYIKSEWTSSNLSKSLQMYPKFNKAVLITQNR